MKCMSMNGCYKLPDNFEGSFADALRLLADHLDDESKPFGPPSLKWEGAVKKAGEIVFKDFWECPEDFSGVCSLSKLSKNGETMEKMDLKLKGK